MNTRRLSALTTLALTAALGVSACTTPEESAAPVTVTESAAPAGEYESADLLRRLIEEEKVAHDLYLAFDEMYGARVFRNITGAEVSHQDQVLKHLHILRVADVRPDGYAHQLMLPVDGNADCAAAGCGFRLLFFDLGLNGLHFLLHRLKLRHLRLHVVFFAAGPFSGFHSFAHS